MVKALSPLHKEIFDKALSILKDEQRVLIWLEVPLYELGWSRPIDLVERGRIELLEALLSKKGE